jgi:hypothetical protein
VRSRALRSILLASLVVLAACGTVLGIDDDDPGRPQVDGGGEAATGGEGGPGGGDAHMDGGSDAPRHKIVFVTSTTHRANLGGLDGGDDICANEARANGLTGTFIAYLHQGGGDPGHPSRRLEDAGWARVDGVVAFTGHPHDNRPAVPVDLDADGGLVDASARVWTGLYNGPSDICMLWNSASASSSAGWGNPHAANSSQWHVTTSIEGCDSRLHLYCFEK